MPWALLLATLLLLTGCVLDVHTPAKDIAKPSVSFETPSLWDCTGTVKLPINAGLEQCHICINTNPFVQFVTIDQQRQGVNAGQGVYVCESLVFIQGQTPQTTPLPYATRSYARGMLMRVVLKATDTAYDLHLTCGERPAFLEGRWAAADRGCGGASHVRGSSGGDPEQVPLKTAESSYRCLIFPSQQTSSYQLVSSLCR
jgi:hypothetical protein